jgi:hypothetical protein
MLLFYESAWFFPCFYLYWKNEKYRIVLLLQCIKFNIDLINNDNGHPSFHYHSLQFNSFKLPRRRRLCRRKNHSIRFFTSKFYLFHCFPLIDRSIRFKFKYILFIILTMDFLLNLLLFFSRCCCRRKNHLI